jgi:hypothetical protein
LSSERLLPARVEHGNYLFQPSLTSIPGLPVAFAARLVVLLIATMTMIVTIRAALALCVAGFVLSCHDEASTPVAAVSGASAKTKTPASPASTFGRPIEASETVSLADIAKSPAAYKGKPVSTQGTVTRVCQERGCWMAIKDDSSTATVRMHGHGFFVPTTSAGKHARVGGTVVLMKDGRECDDIEAVDAKLELDATGVEFD